MTMNRSTFKFIKSNDCRGEVSCLDSGGTVQGDILGHKPGMVMLDGDDGKLRRVIYQQRNPGEIGDEFVILDMTLME